MPQQMQPALAGPQEKVFAPEDPDARRPVRGDELRRCGKDRVGVQHPEWPREAVGVADAGDLAALNVENGRKNVKSAPYWPILSANRRRQRPTAVYAHADPAQNGQNGPK